jgi:hypothetical protein
VVILRASGSRAFRAAALIASVAEEDSGVIALVVEDSVAAVIASVVAVALAASAAAVAGSGAGAEINAWRVLSYFL